MSINANTNNPLYTVVKRQNKFPFILREFGSSIDNSANFDHRGRFLSKMGSFCFTSLT